MVKRVFPIIFIFVFWLIFAKPYFFESKIPFPSDLQVNHFSLWAEYPRLWGPIKNPAQPDAVNQLMPWKNLTIESWKDFQVPLWNPYSFSGTPHLANYQSSVFSIINLFYFIFNFNDAWSIAVLIQPLLAGIFMYIFIRSLKLSQTAALVAAISFMFSGFIVVWMSYGTLSLAISFLPLALFAAEKYLDSKKYRYLFLISFTFPFSFFSGHFQTSIYFSLFVFSYILFKFLETKQGGKILNLLIFSFLGVLLSAPQILPSIELYLESYRGFIFQKIDAVPFKYLPTIISPDFYGNPVTRNNFFGNYAEWNGFLGSIPFLIGIYAIFVKNKQVLFFLSTGIIALLLCLDTKILDLFISLKIPVLSTSSVSRILAIFSFSFAVLSAFGIDKLTSSLKDREFKSILIWIIVSACVFIVLWGSIIFKLVDEHFYQISLRNLILPSILFAGLVIAVIIGLINKNLIKLSLIILVILTSFEMLRFANKWQPFSLKDLAFQETPIISKLSSLGNINRVYGPLGAEGSVFYHIPGTEGYDPIYIKRYGDFLGALNDGKITPSARSGVNLPVNAKLMPKVFDFMGIKYILLKRQDKNKSWAFPFKKYPNEFKLIYREKDYYIYENKNVFPRAFLVGDYEIIPEGQKIIDKVLDKKFDLRRSVVLEKNPKIQKSDNLEGNAIITNYSPNHLEIKTKSNKDSVLVLSDNYFPGWKAKVNGKPVEIMRANFAFRSISIPKGESEIEFYYLPDSFRFGVIISVLSFLLIGLKLTGKWYTSRIWTNKPQSVKFVTKSSAKTVNGKLTKKTL